MSNHSGHSHDNARPKLAIRKLLEAPSLHQDWDERGKSQTQEERKVSWSELFFDLFYVVACINLSHLLEAELSLEGFGKFFLYFTYFWCIWASLTIFQSRIKLTGLVFDYTTLIYMLGVLGMILHSSNASHHKHFAASYSVCRITSMVKYLIAAVTIPRARAAGLTLSVLYGGLAIAGGILVAFPWSAFVPVSIVILIAENFAPLFPLFIPSARIPVHVDHVGERYGLVMMIFLGETVIGLGLQKLTFEVEQYAAIVLAATICFNLHLLYYHGHPDQHLHALRIHRYRGMFWSFSHWFLGASFLLVGTAIRMVVSSYVPPEAATSGHRRFLLADSPSKSSYPSSYPSASETADAGAHKGPSFHPGHVSDDVAWLLCIAYGLALHILAFIRASHYYRNPVFYRARAQLGLQSMTDIWWALVFLWPFAAYFIAFANKSIHGVGLLAFLAGHGILFNIAETMITHKISQHDWASVIEAQQHVQPQYVAVEAGAVKVVAQLPLPDTHVTHEATGRVEFLDQAQDAVVHLGRPTS